MSRRNENGKAYELVRRLNEIPVVRAIKTHGNQFLEGEPDIVGSWYGISFVIEMKKSTREKPEPIQEYKLGLWRKAGAIVLVEHDVTQAFNRLRDEIHKRRAQ